MASSACNQRPWSSSKWHEVAVACGHSPALESWRVMLLNIFRESLLRNFGGFGSDPAT
jgi:hypothetical protein